MTLDFDLNSPVEALREKLEALIEGEGFIDMVVNTSGYLLQGAVEETRYVFET